MAIVLTLQSARLLWRYSFVVPFWDMVDLVRFLDDHSELTLSLFQYKSNEHRPYLPLLLYFVDHQWFGARGLLLMPAMYALNVVLAFVAVGWAWSRAMSWPVWAASTATSLAAFFSVSHYENLLWPMQIHEILSLVLLGLSCLVAAAVGARGNEATVTRDVALAAAAGLLAAASTYSFMFGIVAFPVIGIHALLARWRPAAIVVFVATAVVVVTAYALDYHVQSKHTHPLEAIAHMPELLVYVMRVLGSTIQATGGFIATLAIPIVLLALAGSGVVAYARYRSPHRLPRSNLAAIDACLLIAGCAIACALLIGLGRLGMSIASRYYVVATLFSMAMFGLLILWLPQARRSVAAVLFAAATLIVIAKSNWKLEQFATLMSQAVAAGGVAATYDAVVTGMALDPSPATVTQVWTRARGSYPSYRDSVPFVWIGRPVAALPQTGPDVRCAGQVVELKPADLAKRVYHADGWGLVTSGKLDAVWGLLVEDTSGLVVGLGRLGTRRQNETESKGWRGHVLHGLRALVQTTPGAPLSLWLADDRGQVCATGATANVR